MKWKSTDIKALAEERCASLSPFAPGSTPDLTVEISGAWGDYDTDRIYIWYKKHDEDESDFVTIAAFDPESTLDDAARSECELSSQMIEMSSRHGSGVVTDHESLMLAAWRTKQALEAAGWCVVDDMENYF